MTAKEMTEIFTLMSLAWPNAEMFKGGAERLGPTIALWVSCLPEVDFWTAQQATIKLCRECKFPPSIAEFKEKAEEVHKDINRFVNESMQLFKTGEEMYGSLDAYIAKLPEGDPRKIVIDTMGGPDALVVETEKGMQMWNYDGFRKAYTGIIRKDPAICGGMKLALPDGRRKEKV